MDASSLLGGLLELLPVPLAGLAYAKRAQTLAKRGTPVPPARRLAFAAGLTLILIALFTPIARLADDLVYMHMVEHLLIGDLAALLLVLGLTGPILQPILKIRGLHWLQAISAPWGFRPSIIFARLFHAAALRGASCSERLTSSMASIARPCRMRRMPNSCSASAWSG